MYRLLILVFVGAVAWLGSEYNTCWNVSTQPEKSHVKSTIKPTKDVRKIKVVRRTAKKSTPKPTRRPVIISKYDEEIVPFQKMTIRDGLRNLEIIQAQRDNRMKIKRGLRPRRRGCHFRKRARILIEPDSK